MLILKDFFLIFSHIIRLQRPFMLKRKMLWLLKKEELAAESPPVHTFCSVLPAMCNTFLKLTIYHYSSLIFTTVDEIPVYSFRESRIWFMYENLCFYFICQVAFFPL